MRLLFTYGEAVVDEGVDGADPEDEESPDQLPGRLVPEHSPGAWSPDGNSQLFRFYVFGPSGLKDYGSATLRCKT